MSALSWNINSITRMKVNEKQVFLLFENENAFCNTVLKTGIFESPVLFCFGKVTLIVFIVLQKRVSQGYTTQKINLKKLPFNNKLVSIQSTRKKYATKQFEKLMSNKCFESKNA